MIPDLVHENVEAPIDLADVRVGQVRAAFRDVVRSARLWHIWVRLGVQDVRHKFRRSTVGPAWIFLNLGVLIGAIGIIYGRLLGQDLHQFIPYLTAGLIVWGYLTTSITEGAHAFVNSEGYIKPATIPSPPNLGEKVRVRGSSAANRLTSPDREP